METDLAEANMNSISKLNLDASEKLLQDTMIEKIVIDFLSESDLGMSQVEHEFGSSIYCLTSNHSLKAAQLFRWFRSLHCSCDRNNGDERIREMLQVFRRNKEIFSPSLREYILIEGILELCYRLQINNEIVREVLDAIYETWSSFGPLHFTIIFKSRIFRPNFPPGEEGSGGILSYILEQARRMKLVYNSKPLIDVSLYSNIYKTPIFIAAESWCWKAVLKYLQYGASFESVPVTADRSRHGVTLAMVDTLRTFICHLWTDLVEPLESCSTEREVHDVFKNLPFDIDQMWKTFAVILRAVRYIDRPMLLFLMYVPGDWDFVQVSSFRVLTHPVMDEILPMLRRLYGEPPPLKHSCRYAIRKRLNENWELPKGIRSLPLPKQMKNYVNLLID